MIKQAVILCGGKGTRLGEKTADFPKPLLDVGGVPLLDRTIQMLAAQGVETTVKDHAARRCVGVVVHVGHWNAGIIARAGVGGY